MDKSTLKPYTFAIRTSQRSNQKLQKSMSLPTQRNMLTKYDIMNEIIKHESTTLYISNGGQSAINEPYKYNLTMVQKMKVSAKITATAHILDRYTQKHGA